jgi:hypothetical protein
MTEELIRAKTTALPPSAGHSLPNAIPGLRGFESVDRVDPVQAFDPLRRCPTLAGADSAFGARCIAAFWFW